MSPLPLANSTMRLSHFAPVTVSLLGVGLLFTGCVSNKYKTAPKDTPPPVALNLAVNQPPVAATVNTVIVYQGPGSWKKEAYWDEYAVTLANHGSAPLMFDSATLIDGLDLSQACGADPWMLEHQSRENMKKFEHVGRKILIGAGLTLGWATAGGLTATAAWAGAGTAAAVGATAFLALPVWAISSGVRTLVARSSITDEFNRRRLALPVTLQPGETKRGSLFFPISPGPQRLELHCHANGEARLVAIDLAPLAGLHLLKQLAGGAPAPTKP